MKYSLFINETCILDLSYIESLFKLPQYQDYVMQALVQEIQAADLDHHNDDFQIIDVRTIPEIATGRIETAYAMPLASMPMRMTEIRSDKKVVIVCRSGARSAQACMFLKQNGFDNVYNLQGGMIGWVRANKPLTTG